MSASKIQFACRCVMPTASASSASCCPRSGRNPCENPKKSCALPPRWSVRRSPGSRASYHGARRHAARQQTWRARQAQKVTHQGSLATAVAVIVVSTSITTTTQETHADIACFSALSYTATFDITTGEPGRWPVHRHVTARARCRFCGRVLPRLARFGPLRGGP